MDLSGVRLHTGTDAAAASRRLSARAFTIGADVYFDAGEYRPADPAGMTLLAHEVAHSVQQTRAGSLTPTTSSTPSDRNEHAADAAAASIVAGRRVGPELGRAPLGVQRKQRPTTGYLWVPFDESGGWDGAAILQQVSQLENTPTVIPEHLPGAGEESDRKRCGSNAALTSAIVAGPQAVIQLSRNLLARIESYRYRGSFGESEMPSEGVCDRAAASVRRIMIDVYLGTQGDAHEGAGGTLQYRDFDVLAHWLYVFSYNPSDGGRVAGSSGVGQLQGEGRRWRTPAEIVDAAELAGQASGQDWHELPTWEDLVARVDALPDGGSLLVLISTQPHAANATYRHTITFFRQGGVSYVHDSWGGGNVFPSTDPRFKAALDGAYDEPGGKKPQGLFYLPPPPPPSLLDWYLLR